MTDGITAGNPFSAESLSGLLLLSVEHGTENQIEDEFDLVALTVHVGMLVAGFMLLSVGEGRDKVDCKSSAESPVSLPQSWNQNNNSYTFTYTHSQSSMQFLIKISRMLHKAIVAGMADGDDQHRTFDLAPLDHVRPSLTYPLRVADGSTANHDSTEVAKRKLQNDVFQSRSRMADIATLLQQRILQKLAPDISKPSHDDDPAAADGDLAADGARPGGRTEAHPRNPHPGQGDVPDPARPNPYPHHDPLAVPRPPRRDPGELYPPGFTDEYEINRPPGRNPAAGGPLPAFGESDLYPAGLGPRDPMRPFFGPAGGLGGVGGPGGGGMHPSFDDPLFMGEGGRGGGYDPQAPPGARFDPVNPGQRGPPQGGLGGGPRGFGGAPPNPFGGFGDGDFI